MLFLIPGMEDYTLARITLVQHTNKESGVDYFKKASLISRLNLQYSARTYKMNYGVAGNTIIHHDSDVSFPTFSRKKSPVKISTLHRYYHRDISTVPSNIGIRTWYGISVILCENFSIGNYKYSRAFSRKKKHCILRRISANWCGNRRSDGFSKD